MYCLLTVKYKLTFHVKANLRTLACENQLDFLDISKWRCTVTHGLVPLPMVLFVLQVSEQHQEEELKHDHQEAPPQQQVARPSPPPSPSAPNPFY